MDKKNFKAIVIIGVVFCIIFGIYILITRIINQQDDSGYLKNYNSNEYIPTYITDEMMAEIYFSDYTNYLYSNINKAYDLLNNEYKAKKFGSIANFQNYINSIDLNSLDMKKFAIKNSGGYEYFYIYDNSDRLYIFKTKGVMQYEVYLDETTVSV